jgi:UDPglucose--hexose-1-phosphate uridylyltransferase
VSERRRDPSTGEWTTFAAARAPGDACVVCEAFARLPVDFGAAYESVVIHGAPRELAAEDGRVEIVAYAREHGMRLADVGVERLERLVEVWADRYAQLGARPDVAYVLVFEDADEPRSQHPHARLHASSDVPPRPRVELAAARAHLEEHGTCVVCDVVADERSHGARRIGENVSFLAHVPYAARYPYEVHLTAQRHAPSLLDLTDAERRALAELLHEVLAAYARVLGPAAPYVLAVHQAPTDDGGSLPFSHLHVELLPRPTAATQRAYVAGADVAGGEHVNDVLPEAAAAELRTALATGGGQ